jgi:four helix bundle protein
MDEKAFKARTKKLAVAIIKQIDKLPNSRAANVVARQVIRSGTSIGANYRAACRAKSTPDLINKMKIVEEEADEILAMTVGSIKTHRNHRSKI